MPWDMLQTTMKLDVQLLSPDVWWHTLKARAVQKEVSHLHLQLLAASHKEI